MQAKRIKRKDVRVFGEVDLTRPDGNLAGWTAPVEYNGCWKPALLPAIALLMGGSDLGRQARRALRQTAPGGAAGTRVKTHAVVTGLDGRESTARLVAIFWPDLCWAAMENGSEPTLSVYLNHNSETTTNQPTGPRDDGKPANRTTDPCCSATDTQRLMAGPNRIARFVNLSREDASFPPRRKKRPARPVPNDLSNTEIPGRAQDAVLIEVFCHRVRETGCG